MRLFTYNKFRARSCCMDDSLSYKALSNVNSSSSEIMMLLSSKSKRLSTVKLESDLTDAIVSIGLELFL